MISAYIIGDKCDTGRELLEIMEFTVEWGNRLNRRVYKTIIRHLLSNEDTTNGHEVHANIFQGDKYLFTITYQTKYGVVFFDEDACFAEYGINGYIFINGSLVRSFVVAC